jgi:hypothetical protein
MAQVIAAVGDEAQHRLANAPPRYNETDASDTDDRQLAAD